VAAETGFETGPSRGTGGGVNAARRSAPLTAPHATNAINFRIVIDDPWHRQRTSALSVNWTLLVNSLLVASIVSALAVAAGLVTAMWLACLRGSLRLLALGACVMTAALPPFLVVNSWIDLFGRTGSLHWWLPFDLYSFTGCVVLMTTLFWPVAALLIFAAWRQANPELWEAELELRGRPFVSALLWPQARTAIAQSAGLIFVLALNQFSVPTILQVRIYPEELWVRFNTTFNFNEALTLSWPMLFFPLLLVASLVKRPIQWPRGLRDWNAAEFRRKLGGSLRVVTMIAAGGVLLLSLGLPLGQLLFAKTTWSKLVSAWTANRTIAFQSIMVASVPAVATLAGGWMLSRTRWGVVFWPLYFLPGVLLGMGLIFLANRKWLDWVYTSVAILFIALGLRYLAPAWYGARLVRRTLDRDLADTGRLGGARGWQRWHLVDWPQVRPQLLALAYVLYLLCLWDVETINLIVPPDGETLALRIFNFLHYGHTGEVNALCLLLLLIALLPLGVGMLAVRTSGLLKGGGR
jgi:iron(III) transport system permease protein